MYQPQYGVPQQGMQQVPYGMPGIQAAAMAATAAASGSNYPYMHPDPNMPHTSPRIGAGQKKDGRPSPRMANMAQMPGRRLSQVASPGVPNTQAMIGARGGVAPPQIPPGQALPHPQSPDVPAAPVEESPLYVNAKQFHRILKRRVARQRLEEQLRLTAKGRKPYLHESRHNHAMRRPRGPGGRFLTTEEVAALERGETLDHDNPPQAQSARHHSPAATSGGSKRKSDAPESQSKKARTDDGKSDGQANETEES